MRRRDFLLSCFRLLSFMVGFRAVRGILSAEETSAERISGPYKKLPIGGHFVGERLVYEITFMMLFNAARLVVELLPDKKRGHFIASFQAETKGLVGWAVGYRKYLFRTFMEEIDGGDRFLAHRFETSKSIRKKKHDKIYQFDYQKKELHIRLLKGGVERKFVKIPFLPKENYNDILSIFYNFRYGAFGPIERERKYKILGLPRNNKDKKEIYYTVDIFSEETEAARRDDLGWEHPGYVARVQIDKDILASKDGIIWVLLREEMVPLMGLLKDAVGFGDIVGELTK